MVNNISFNARFVSPATVKQIGLNNYIKDKRVSFVELDCFSNKDCEAVKATSSLWDRHSTFAANIAERISDCNWIGYRNGKRFFAITQQKKKFEDLDPQDILALAEVIDLDKDGNSIKLSYLQADPDNNHLSRDREFKGVGTSLINSLKNFFKGMKISVYAVDDSDDFYKANGFKHFGHCSEYEYTPEN